MSLRLGVIGLSEGNGHPYSWSAIFNGYDSVAMRDCGFPAIPEYLARQSFPQDAIAEASVTHVWSQDMERARHIAAAARIGTVVSDYRDMMGAVDGVLLARDDAGRHEEMAGPFLDAGLPIYIDKPLALSLDAARRMLGRQKYPGQLFSCSALKYAQELQLSDTDREQIGAIRLIQATVPKDWDCYAIHVIDPILKMLGDPGGLSSHSVQTVGKVTGFVATLQSGVLLQLAASGGNPAPIAIKVFGERGFRELVFRDSFTAFRAALDDFVKGILRREIRSSEAELLAAIELVEAGRS